jgi:hypothetical protein
MAWQMLRRSDEVDGGGRQRGGGMDWPVTVQLVQDELQISWPALPQADLYHVRLVSLSGQLVWETETAMNAASVELSTDQRSLVVRVTATGASGFVQESAPTAVPALH